MDLQKSDIYIYKWLIGPNMNEKQYANIMTAIAMNANDREYTQLEHFMRELLEQSIGFGEEE